MIHTEIQIVMVYRYFRTESACVKFEEKKKKLFLKGIDQSDGIPYEEKLCKNSQPRGIISLGDSVTAHFHLPEEWFDGSSTLRSISTL